MTQIGKHQVLVLNNDFQAIGVCSVDRGFCLVYLGKADLVIEDPRYMLRSLNTEYKFPSVIRLRRYIALPFRKVQLTRQNVFRRDGMRCVYCEAGDHLTIDHVIPKVLGGKDVWENLVTACRRCNAKKGKLSVEEAEMTMRRPPFKPSFVMFLSNFSGVIPNDWKPYLYMD